MDIKKFNIMNKIKNQSERVLLETWIRLILSIYSLASIFIVNYSLYSNRIFGNIFQVLLQIYLIWFLKHSKTLSTKWIILWFLVLLYFLPSVLRLQGLYGFIIFLTYIDMLIYLYKSNKKIRSE